MMRSYLVLDEDDMRRGAHAGIERTLNGIFRGLTDQFGAKRNWEGDIEACLAELALAKARGLQWHGVNEERGIDVGSNTEVRHTPLPYGRLILHRKDKDKTPYWLVTGRMGRYTFRGWIYALAGKLDKWWKDPTHQNRWAFFVPQKDLNSIDDPPEVSD